LFGQYWPGATFRLRVVPGYEDRSRYLASERAKVERMRQLSLSVLCCRASRERMRSYLAHRGVRGHVRALISQTGEHGRRDAPARNPRTLSGQIDPLEAHEAGVGKCLRVPFQHRAHDVEPKVAETRVAMRQLLDHSPLPQHRTAGRIDDGANLVLADHRSHGADGAAGALELRSCPAAAALRPPASAIINGGECLLPRPHRDEPGVAACQLL